MHRSRKQRGTVMRSVMCSLADIVGSYTGHPTPADSCRARLANFLRYFEHRKTIDEAIQAAIMRNHPHQNCLSWKKRRQVHQSLLSAAASLDAESTFEGIFAIVESCVRPPFKNADLLIYELSLRLGAYRKALPTSVYLHSGTLKGAKFILGNQALPWAVPLTKLPSAFSPLLPHEAEDCLCIYKAKLEVLRKIGALP